MIAFINRLAENVARQGRIPAGIIRRIKNYCWIQTLGFWMFDLRRPDAPWRKFREPHAGSVRWELATIENCQRWIQSGTDGFTSWQGETLIQLVEQKHLVLVGYANKPDESNSQVPDCYGALVLERKPMTKQCSFFMEPDEGTLRTFYTREQARGRGLATQMFIEFCRVAEERGITKVYADIAFSNIASYRAAEKAGAVRMRDVVVYETTLFKRACIFVCGSLKNRFHRKRSNEATNIEAK